LRKLFSLTILGLLVCSMSLLADDGRTMSQKMIRFTVAPNFTMFDKDFDRGGGKVDAATGNTRVFNLAFAVEYGITDWLTAAIQWAPGINAYTSMDGNSGGISFEKAKMKLTEPLFLGALMQIIGPSGVALKNERIRVSVAPGVKVPLGTVNYVDEFTKAAIGGSFIDDFTASGIDKPAVGMGARIFFDYIVNPGIFINLANQTLFYPISVKAKNNPTEAVKALMAGQIYGAEYGNAYADSSLNYGFDTWVELEPQMMLPLTKGEKPVLITAGLPIRYTYNPEYKVDGSAVDGTSTHALNFNPHTSLFFTSWKVPMEFMLQYTGVLAGVGEHQSNNLSFAIKSYIQI